LFTWPLWGQVNTTYSGSVSGGASALAHKAALNYFAGSTSCYTTKPVDTAAYYFTPESAGMDPEKFNTGQTDISRSLQQAIYKLKREKNFGILFIPEGTYLISQTIYVPAAIRLIGYGKHRPVIRLKDRAAGFISPVTGDKGGAAYMFWFTSGIPSSGRVPDAGAGTFYSGMSNINLEIGQGNSSAVALRTHFAQHSFIEHVDIAIGEGKAGIFDVGNELQDVKFYGGDYGIYTTKSSPGWQFMMLDTYFEGQRRAAIRTQEAGLTIVRLQAKNVPVVIDVDAGFWEKLYMEDCALDQVGTAAIRLGLTGTPETQVNLQNIRCHNVAQLVTDKDKRLQQQKETRPVYLVKRYTAGLVMDSVNAVSVEKVACVTEPVANFDASLPSDIPIMPPTADWVNVKTLGALGDGVHDETAVLQKAIARYPVLYFPEGRYRISRTLHLKPGTKLIGLHPFATQILLEDNTPAFSGFGGPVPMIISSKGGQDMITGIGLSTGKRNTRAVALQWEAGSASLVNDVKFLGGHGQMHSPVYPEGGGPYDRGEEGLWDRQYWSLWVTGSGGGIFKNIWSASTYSAAGVYISNTTTEGRIYAMSIEHHKRNEVRFNNVHHWKIYAMQTEEESKESSDCQPLMVESSTDLQFSNLYMFRVIRVNKTYPYAILTADSKDIHFLNIHNYAQTKYISSHSLYDLNSGNYVRPWELAALHLLKAQRSAVNQAVPHTGTAESSLRLIARGFDMPVGFCSDKEGNVYFCESTAKRIYKWSRQTGLVTLIGDYPWEPLSLGLDTKGDLLVVFKYEPMVGHLVNGQQEAFENPPDAAGTSFSGWGNSGFASWVYSLDPADPDHTIKLCKRAAIKSLDTVAKAYYPAHRWRDYHDFKKMVMDRPDSCWVAPDGKTIIPVVYDLARATSLAAAGPGGEVFVTDEYNELSYRLKVDTAAYLSDLSLFAPRGSFAIVPTDKNDVWIADGDLYQYTKEGRLKRQIGLEERVTGFAPVGTGSNALIVGTYDALYLLAGQ